MAWQPPSFPWAIIACPLPPGLKHLPSHARLAPDNAFEMLLCLPHLYTGDYYYIVAMTAIASEEYRAVLSLPPDSTPHVSTMISQLGYQTMMNGPNDRYHCLSLAPLGRAA